MPQKNITAWTRGSLLIALGGLLMQVASFIFPTAAPRAPVVATMSIAPGVFAGNAFRMEVDSQVFFSEPSGLVHVPREFLGRRAALIDSGGFRGWITIADGGEIRPVLMTVTADQESLQ